MDGHSTCFASFGFSSEVRPSQRAECEELSRSDFMAADEAKLEETYP
jgi:hypothetical protein